MALLMMDYQLLLKILYHSAVVQVIKAPNCSRVSLKCIPYTKKQPVSSFADSPISALSFCDISIIKQSISEEIYNQSDDLLGN